MADPAGIAAITGGTSAVIAGIGYLNSRSQTNVTLETVKQHTATEKAKLDHELALRRDERAEKYREQRTECYREYLALSLELMEMLMGLKQLDAAAWRDWRARDSVASSKLELICSDAVLETVSAFESVTVKLFNPYLDPPRIFEVERLRTEYPNSPHGKEFVAAWERLRATMRSETTPK